MKDRYNIILKTSIIGIIVNVFLVAIKALVGLLSNSIAIVLDAINNLIDAVSSIVTIVGIKLATKEADKKHPFGYGRIEYISTLVIGVLITYAGITAGIESIKGIITPETSEYNATMLFLIVIAVIAKIILGLFFKKSGKKANSDSLVAAGNEAVLDSIVSIATLIAALIYIFFGISLEAYLAFVIAILIIKTGIEVLLETISKILGEGANAELVKSIKKTILQHNGVIGAYDLVLNGYGQDVYVASVHIEVQDTMTANEIDVLTREISDDVYRTHHMILSAIGIYSHNTINSEISNLENLVVNIATNIEHIHQVHGFYADLSNKKIRFDMVVSFDAPNRPALKDMVLTKIKEQLPDYDIDIKIDLDFNELTL